jgi:hypothetical protein
MKDYFREGRAVISFNSSTIEKNITKVVPKGHAAVPAFGTYNITPFSH